jgi:hypothetical protein
MPVSALRLPASVSRTRARLEDGHGDFLSIPRSCIRAGALAGITVPRLTRYLALARSGLYWMRPDVGRAATTVPAETQFLL